MKYRKKPVIIEAVQYTGPAYLRINDEIGAYPQGVQWGMKAADSQLLFPYVTTIHGQETWIEPGDWIIPERDGVHFYPCKPEVFAASYEPVEEEQK